MNTLRPPGAPLPPTAGLDLAPSVPVAPSAPAALTPAQSVLADLQAARITPDEAVSRLTAQALASSGCPASLRPAVEARMRAAIAGDPLVGSLLRRMGANVPAEE